MNHRALTLLWGILAAAMGVGIGYLIFNLPSQRIMVAIGAALAFYPIIRYPIVGMYTVVCLSPFIPFIRRLYSVTHGRPGVDPLIVLPDTLLILTVIGLFFRLKDEWQTNGKVRNTGMLVFAYFAYMLVRVFVFNEHGAAYVFPTFKSYGPMVLFFFVGIVYGDQLHHMKRLWAITVLLAVIASLYGFKQLLVGFSHAESVWVSSVNFTSLFVENIPRPFSVFQAPVAFADYAQLGVLGALMMMAWQKGRARFIWLLLVGLFFYAILITSVRSSWIGVMLSLLLWFFLFRFRSMSTRIAALVVVGLGYATIEFVAGFSSVGLGMDSFLELVTSVIPDHQRLDMLVTKRSGALTDPFGEHSFLSRMVLWRYIFKLSMVPEYAILGRGLGCLKADSLYVTYLAEFGYPGVLLIVFLFVYFTKKAMGLASRATDPVIAAIAKGTATMNIVFAVVSFTGTHIHYFPGDAYFWLWNGVVIKLISITGLDESEETTIGETASNP
jgi:hypothetical protein